MTTQIVPKRLSDRSLDRVYPYPHTYLTDIDWARWHHEDLTHLDGWELDCERSDLLRRLRREHCPVRRAWLVDRRAAIYREINQRQRGRRR